MNVRTDQCNRLLFLAQTIILKILGEDMELFDVVDKNGVPTGQLVERSEAHAKDILHSNPQADRHPFYGEWVQGYTSEGYHDGNQDLIALTEKLTKDYTEEQLQHLEEIFVNCSRYESLFWDMAWEMRL